MAPARVPDFATLSKAAFQAADLLIAHIDGCQCCAEENSGACLRAAPLVVDYRIRKDKALKAIRGRKKA